MANENKPAPETQKKKDAYPGMLGDGTEEQNLDQPGNPDARITQADVDAAFKTTKDEGTGTK